MTQRIKIINTKTGETTVGETKLRNTMHFEVQKNTRAHIFRAKKGKGSYTRKQKYSVQY